VFKSVKTVCVGVIVPLYSPRTHQITELASYKVSGPKFLHFL